MDIGWAKALTIISILTSSNCWANDIYVNQVGDDFTLNVIQDGEDNYFQYCTNGSDSNCKDVNGNAHNRADGFASDNAVVNSGTLGDDNKVVIAHATGTGNTNINESARRASAPQGSACSSCQPIKYRPHQWRSDSQSGQKTSLIGRWPRFRANEKAGRDVW